MAKSKPENETKEERRMRKDAKKVAKSGSGLLAEDAGVTKNKSDKKEKKKKREALAEKALNTLEGTTGGESNGKKGKKKEKGEKKVKVEAESEEEEEEEEDGEVEMKDESETEVENKKAKKGGKTSLKDRPVGALVPFAHPLADEKVGKKVFRGVKKAAAQRTLKRGVKEVVKALRKSQTSLPASSISMSTDANAAEIKDLPLGIVVLAADISPMDVISHIPVLCEDHNIPYIFVTSRAELGMAGMTKRPTSVVMVGREEGKKRDGDGKGGKKEDDGEGDGEAWSDTYRGLVKVVARELPKVRK